jgi:hypothetical protein
MDETRGDLEVRPATRDRWDDLEKLFGKSGSCSVPSDPAPLSVSR